MMQNTPGYSLCYGESQAPNHKSPHLLIYTLTFFYKVSKQ